uniref:Ribonuclease K n=1 Tax=Vombatus ursinus TaxID=29139 RepID=A0A4X2K132_VOMUR
VCLLPPSPPSGPAPCPCSGPSRLALRPLPWGAPTSIPASLRYLGPGFGFLGPALRSSSCTVRPGLGSPWLPSCVVGPSWPPAASSLAPGGVIMLVLLGIFFNVHSAVLIEDVPLTESDFTESGPQKIYELYEQVSYNCFIAAGLYLLLGGFSFCQVRLNKRKEYMVR